jgi:hypothetical protein
MERREQRAAFTLKIDYTFLFVSVECYSCALGTNDLISALVLNACNSCPRRHPMDTLAKSIKYTFSVGGK